jgi:hypothetical protein
VSRLYQPVDLIPAGDIQESRKVKKLEEISSKSARLLQGLSRNLQFFSYFVAVLGIRIRRIRMFLGLLDPLFRGMDPDTYLFS